ncbi:hypothetical protein EDD36DRAFT_285492 [Exophiala viscosa]|uniref:RING-type domain-containing protein n=1 Tax=Exophiala viscosa TaxID=2486360 RepID=A0AAN6DTH1_9EURO|nr:hypothetical protein EDD36DRAFT_285492 [Exophiala viscosa]
MAATTSSPSTGLLNLEKELVCFICTEILYQPLTLIDCLHTFCGSCLKEWFSHQHRKATHSHSSSSASPYTCPTCRAPVKDAQHNAMINTLLDMFLVANPSKGRSPEEKAEMSQAYKPGDEIMPKVESHRRRERRRRDDEENDTRISGARGQQLHPSSADNRRAPRQASSRSRESRERSERSDDSAHRDRGHRQPSADAVVSRPRNAGSPDATDRSSLSPLASSPRHPDAVEARQRGARTVAHQASLRSIVSASESGTGTGDSLNEAQLMQEILSEGLLDGINLDDLTEAEQDELSEYIAERYRQLHPERARRTPSDESRHEIPPRTAVQPVEQLEEADRVPCGPPRGNQRRPIQPSPRSSRNVVIGGSGGRPPTSFPQTGIDPAMTMPQDARHRRTASNESGRSEPSSMRTGRRSATDLVDRPQSSSSGSGRPRQLSNTNRAQTEPRNAPRVSEVWQAAGRQIGTPAQTESPGPQSLTPDHVGPMMSGVNNAPVPTVMAGLDSATSTHEWATSLMPTGSRNIEQPAVSCAHCSRANIEYEVHRHCAACDLDLCLRCYRAGRGCNHWFGFGHAAMVKFEASHTARSSQAIELPHILVGRQYQKIASRTGGNSRNGTSTSSVATVPPQEGNFCDRCGAFANDCFWACDVCNDGEWGFCKDCVNTNHCCRHPLLPVAHKSYAPGNFTQQVHNTTQASSMAMSPYNARIRASSPAHSAPSSANSTNGPASSHRADFVSLIITTHCDDCSRSISPEEMRYHCPAHPTPSPDKPEQKGDFDLCNNCYLNLVNTRQIKREDGPDGWRLCPSGHRMVAVTFEQNKDDDQRRTIARDMVGGTKTTEADIAAWKLAKAQLNEPRIEDTSRNLHSRGQWTWREDPSGGRRATRARTATLSSSSNFPPDGGIGKVCRALWSYYPEEGEDGKGELMFPKHADVREVEEVNEEWWFGVYAGDQGVFPAVYVRES